MAVERHHTATAYIVAQGRTLLLWHAKLAMWLPPGGHLEANEDPVQGARREALEESGLEVEVIRPAGLVECSSPLVLPPPAVILIEDIHRPDQPYHQHIDHVYFTVATGEVELERPIPHGPHRWLGMEELAAEFSLRSPDDRLVPVAEDVRLLGVQALLAVSGGP